jgi:hypothetical protein
MSFLILPSTLLRFFFVSSNHLADFYPARSELHFPNQREYRFIAKLNFVTYLSFLTQSMYNSTKQSIHLSIAKFGAKAHGQDSCPIEEYQRLEKVRVVLVSL